MKRIILIRHAKTEEIHSGISDFERSLTERGRNDAVLMGEWLKNKNVFPDLIVTSPAARAIQTAEIFAHILQFPLKQIQAEEFIYSGMTFKEFMKLLATLDNTRQTLVVFGHNPYMTSIAARLGDEDYDHMPTTGIKSLQFETSEWKNVSSANCRFEFFEYPSRLRI